MEHGLGFMEVKGVSGVYVEDGLGLMEVQDISGYT